MKELLLYQESTLPATRASWGAREPRFQGDFKFYHTWLFLLEQVTPHFSSFLPCNLDRVMLFLAFATEGPHGMLCAARVTSSVSPPSQCLSHLQVLLFHGIPQGWLPLTSQMSSDLLDCLR